MRPWMLTLVVAGCLPLVGAEAVGPPRPAETPRLFQPPRKPALPAVREASWVRNPLDHFILARLEAKQLAPTKPADKLKLLRRVSYDLTGLPPTIEEQEAFLADASPDAYEKVVDRLLSSPRFGERWAQHWLDLVRYADTDGFKEDATRPDAFRYRDWVIRALNGNLPYDRFLAWQLAGDELAPGNLDALVATGFNRLWPDEYNAANLEQRRQEILDDTTDTAGLVFLGLTVGCARCHDHKFDPIAQKEYFALQSFFAAMQPRELVLADEAAQKAHQQKREAWEAKTREVREQIDTLLSAKVKQLRDDALTKFNADIQAAVRTAPEQRTPLQWQIALMALKQVERGGEGAPTKLDTAGKAKYEELKKKLAAAGPAPTLPRVMAVVDIGTTAPPTHRLVGGDWRKPAKEILPAFPAVLGDREPDTRLPANVTSTGRRAALARWLTRPDHPLTARVIVNRLWQHHFGVGIVSTSSDFGAQGTPPSHPELLDWLAIELVARGWDLKQMHRLMVTSAAYRQDSVVDPKNALHARGLKVDRENDLLWHARRRRLEGEAIRDAMLNLSGELSPRMFGTSAKPELPAAFGKSAWKPDEKALDRNRRSVYVFAKRNLRYPLFDSFDFPDMHNSCSRRMQTTTAPQALLLLNSELTLGHASSWAEALQTQGDEKAMVASAYRAAWGRPATADEIAAGVRFLARQAAAHVEQGVSDESARTAAVADFCHAVLNTNEFVYVD